jgi:NAD(P)-dependent dehydrogenase (short-subunit alcohol dehydrogenase family)
MDLVERVALITGGKRIGAVVATELARRGADVALVYRESRTEAEETAVAIRALGRRAVTLQADLSSSDEAERIVDEAVGHLGRLDVLVNMASIYRRLLLDEIEVADWDAQMAVDAPVYALSRQSCYSLPTSTSRCLTRYMSSFQS